ncbi:prohibitin family protein [Staphylococcus gallinarum]|uniref:prohibitin family protein n=1 Tax=Staphylococcus gallinarum TaxID=1293 RepID=UPI0030C43EF0
MKVKGLFITFGIILVLGVILLFKSATWVPTGHRAVIYSPSGVKEETLGEGMKFIAPLNKAVKYPVREQNKEYKKISAATTDGKTLEMSTDVQYYVDPNKVVSIFKRFGNADIDALENGYLRARVQDNVRQVVSKYSVIDTFGVKTDEIKGNILKNLKENLEKQGFVVTDISLSSPKADQATQRAIDERVKANQELERAKTDKKISTANSEKKKIEAHGTAKANEIINDSLSDDVLQKQLIDKWHGDTPISIGSGNITDLTGKVGK